MKNYQYFKFVANLDDLKSQYRALCKKHHPDLGGDLETMKAINLEYEERLKSGIFNAEYEETHSSVEIEVELREIIEKTCHLAGLIIEVCGKWIWFTGETYTHKNYLKEIGCRWSNPKKAWYWRSENDASRYKKTGISLEDIRLKYGSIKIENRQYAAIG